MATNSQRFSASGLIDVIPARTILLMAALVQVGIGSFVKLLTESDLTVWNQILLRNVLAGTLALLIVPTAVAKLRHLSFQALKPLAVRALIYVGAIYTFTRALSETTIANVSFIGSFPFVAILGWLFWSERISKGQTIALGVGAVGLAVLSGVRPGQIGLGQGELFAIADGILFALMYLWTRKTPKELTTNEFAALTQVAVLPLVLLFVVMEDSVSSIGAGLRGQDVLLALGAGFCIALNNLFVSSGARRTDASSVSIWLSFSPLFALVASIFIFSDIPTWIEVLGGCLILASAIVFILLDRSKVEQC